MDTKFSVTCPQARRVKSHRSEQAKWRSHKPWKLLVKVHCHDDKDARCVHCGKWHGKPSKKKGGKPTYLTINHLSRALYITEELYTTWNPNMMEICCTTCNWMYEKGKESCPVCHNQYISCMEPDHMCQGCYDKVHPEVVEVREKKKFEREHKLRELKKERNAAIRASRKKVKCGKPPETRYLKRQTTL